MGTISSVKSPSLVFLFFCFFWSWMVILQHFMTDVDAFVIVQHNSVILQIGRPYQEKLSSSSSINQHSDSNERQRQRLSAYISSGSRRSSSNTMFARQTIVEDSNTQTTTTTLVGEDSAYFALDEQQLNEWVKFSAAVAAVLSFVAYIWILPFGLHGGDIFLESIQSTLGTTDPAITVASMLLIFAVAHSGLAGLRTYVAPVIGERIWRVIFAVVSLPLSLSCISYFINHAHEGIQLWATPGPEFHNILWITNFISFLFLYPSTFDLLQIAAIDKPRLRLWETGIIRITRHPQATGQFLWCFAHTYYLGSSTALAASIILCAHHVFACYHGDRRLQQKHGEAFDYIKDKTSILPFAAILDGRQQLPSDYYKEFLRGPYAVVVIGTIAAYYAHPFMQAGAALLNW